jgi:hypothetical protein
MSENGESGDDAAERGLDEAAGSYESGDDAAGRGLDEAAISDAAASSESDQEPQYIILRSENIKNLQDQVNQQLTKGRYYLYHGIQFHNNMYYQTIVKRPENYGSVLSEIFIAMNGVFVSTVADKENALKADTAPLILKELKTK